ncbi:hypothetical protein PV08_05619 [Exophiala spinifera]|uniref:NADP-dependent oxidoreductase domain-containing protein n=1 Tax=Exophiala spinifera TaxID=91928 RepID=A0A0D1YKQ4_9EURO|nr:uncharacterized protein PV08_05619 [Exophiala spinifera]KIW15571.1 hypothetical protein PV08_05619 [Exophiala spinifera]
MAAPTPSGKPRPTIVLGCASFGSEIDPLTRHHTTQQASELFAALTRHRHNIIDTSRRYPALAGGTSEELIGSTLRSAAFPDIEIDTKVLSAPGCHKPENIAKSISDSLRALRVDSVRTIYLHYPDRSVPLIEPIRALSHAVDIGQAKQWGLSNYTIDDVHEVLSLCKKHGLVKPAIFQGEYNAINRDSEELITLLHENGIAFYAYSPAAGGTLSPTGSRIAAQGLGGDRTRQLYGTEPVQKAIQQVRDVAEKNGLNGHETAIRWVVWDSMLDEKYGDGVIIGASSVSQLEETLRAIDEGPLPGEVNQAIEGIWASMLKDKARK